MRKGVALWPLAAKILMACEREKNSCSNDFVSYTLLKVDILWNFCLYYTNFSFKCPLECVFSDKPLIIAFIFNFQFAEILDSQGTWRQKVF
jgi:hypothetical protein